MQSKPKKGNEIWRFAGWGTQLFFMLALVVYGGNKLDQRVDLSFPLFTIAFPFIVIIIMIIKLIKDLSNKNNKNEGK